MRVLQVKRSAHSDRKVSRGHLNGLINLLQSFIVMLDFESDIENL